jgi:hypothetical protein
MRIARNGSNDFHPSHNLRHQIVQPFPLKLIAVVVVVVVVVIVVVVIVVVVVVAVFVAVTCRVRFLCWRAILS